MTENTAYGKFVASCKKAERKASRRTKLHAAKVRNSATIKASPELLHQHPDFFVDILESNIINRVMILGYKNEVLAVDTSQLIRKHRKETSIKCYLCNRGFNKDQSFVDHFKSRCIFICPRKFFRKLDECMKRIETWKLQINETADRFPLVKYLKNFP